MKIPGLCIGAGQSMDVTGIGYVVFMNSTNFEGNTSEYYNFQYYDENVLIPHIERIRDSIGATHNSDGNVSDEFIAVSWFDGAQQQLKVKISEQAQLKFQKAKIVTNKQNPARTAVEQSADVGKTFGVGRSTHQELCHHDSIVTNTSLQISILNAFKEAKETNGLNLGNKQSIVIKALTFMPDVYSKAASVKNLVGGFLNNGMLDRKCEAFPDFGEMIGTLNRTVSKDEYKLLKDTFVPLMKYQVKYGAVPDEVFDQYGYSHDKDDN